nr:PREDICTED: DENN domain-containing protein 1C-like isoform X1 [Lepisosteus oculatus]
MGSRIKENPEGTFYWFFEASCPIAKDKDPEVLFQFPENFNDQESQQTLPRFCFPYDVERVIECPAVQHFTFVLTDLEGNQRFGFCRLTSSSRTCLCILSYLPWFEVFYKLLNNLADCLTKGQKNEMKELLSALYKHPIPQPDSSVVLQLDQELQLTTVALLKQQGKNIKDLSSGNLGLPYFIAPDLGSLPTIPESRNLTELVVTVDVSNLLHLYASMLFERRILITSSKLSTLTACVHATSAMLYPMYWQHIFIPVLPPHLLDYCCAPMPYLIGVHSSLMERVKSRALEDVIILNVDTNTMESPFEDLKKIPSDVVSLLKMKLKKQSAATGDGVARAFLRAQALLFGGYRDALVCELDNQITFSEESFLNHKSNTMMQFLENAVHLQFFKQFIDNRLEKLNSGKQFADVFEEEISHCGVSAGGSKSYQQLVGNLKKGGGALILTVKSRANPAMLNMYKCAKGHAKSGLKEMKNRLTNKDSGDERWLQRGGSLRADKGGGPQFQRRIQSDCLQSRLPITQHFGKSRPRRPPRRFTSPLEEKAEDRNSAWALGWDEDSGSADGEGMGAGNEQTNLEDPDEQFFTVSEEMDLLGEIFDTLSSQSSHERGLLYGTRSLDVFSADNGDYITKLKSVNPSNESLVYSPSQAGSQLSWELDEAGEISLENREMSTEESPVVEETTDKASKSDKDLPTPTSLNVPCTSGSPQMSEGKLANRNSGMWDRGLMDEEKCLKDEDNLSSPVADKSPSSGIPWELCNEIKDKSEIDKDFEKIRKEESTSGNLQESEYTSKQSGLQVSRGCSETDTQQNDGELNTPPEATKVSNLDVSTSTKVSEKEMASQSVPEVFEKKKDKCLRDRGPDITVTNSTSRADSDEENRRENKPSLPRVQSAVALFQSKVTKPVTEGKAQLPIISTKPIPGLKTASYFCRSPETIPSKIYAAPVTDVSQNGILVTSIKTINQDTKQDAGERDGVETPSPANEEDLPPVKKVSELKKSDYVLQCPVHSKHVECKIATFMD